MRYFLDTNIASDMIRHPQGRPARRQAVLGGASASVSAIVAAELRFGALRKGDPTLSGRIDEFLATVDVVPFSPPADDVYARVRVQLEADGLVIGAHDLLIAAHAIAADRILVTDNVREFSRVEGLVVENWLR